MHGNNPEFKTTCTHLRNPMITGQSVYHTNQPSHQLMNSPVCKENQRTVTNICHYHLTFHTNWTCWLWQKSQSRLNYYPKNLQECKENIKHEKRRWIQALATFKTDWSAPNISETCFVKSRTWRLLWVKSLLFFFILILEQTCWRNESWLCIFPDWCQKRLYTSLVCTDI